MNHIAGSRTPDWPADLRRGAVRWQLRSVRYEATVAFYRDLVRLPVIAEFSSSFGEDGTIIGLPGTSVHLEILREPSEDSSAVGHDEIVLYLDGDDTVAAATARLTQAGIAPVIDPHPYWVANDAVTYRDPDGRGLVFAPWVFGRDLDPVDRRGHGAHAQQSRTPDSVLIDWYDGDRRPLRHLFEEAEDSAKQLDSYIGDGLLLVARAGDEILGYLQLVDTVHAGEIELKSMAVVTQHRGAGIGTRLVEEAIAFSRAKGYARMTVATATADIDNLRFYQRRGFRLDSIEPDAFNTAAGYLSGIAIDGIPLNDRVWLVQSLTS